MRLSACSGWCIFDDLLGLPKRKREDSNLGQSAYWGGLTMQDESTHAYVDEQKWRSQTWCDTNTVNGPASAKKPIYMTIWGPVSHGRGSRR
jgi:hypothetical protein